VYPTRQLASTRLQGYYSERKEIVLFFMEKG
jgi:hypothetical protein